MKPLIVLLTTFLISIAVIRILHREYEPVLSARIALATMMLFTAIAHFAFAKGMAMMVPDFIPFKTEVVYFTGLLEIASAPGLLVPATQVLTGWCLIVFFIVLLPANIKAAIQKIDYQKGDYTGNSLNYLWFRVPLQVLFILWTYYAAISSTLST